MVELVAASYLGGWLQRVSGFLLQMADPSMTRGADGISLPMSRYDIADYLALAVEAVSRTLTQLRIRRIMVLPGAMRANRESPCVGALFDRL